MRALEQRLLAGAERRRPVAIPAPCPAPVRAARARADRPNSGAVDIDTRSPANPPISDSEFGRGPGGSSVTRARSRSAGR